LVDRFQVPARARRVPKAAVSAAPWWRNQRPIGSVSHRQAAGVPAHRGPLKVRQSTPLSPCHHRRGRTTRGSREMHWPTSGRACSQREPRRRRRPQSYSPPIPRHRHRRTLTPTTQQLAAAACTSIEQLVHHRGCWSASCPDARRRGFVENLRRLPIGLRSRPPDTDGVRHGVEAIEARSVRDRARAAPGAPWLWCRSAGVLPQRVEQRDSFSALCQSTEMDAQDGRCQ